MRKIKMKRRTTSTREVGVVEGLRIRAEDHIERHLTSPMRAKAGAPNGDADQRPLDLWTAKLLLEIAALYYDGTDDS